MTACRQYGHRKNQNRSHEILPAADVDFDVNFRIRYSEGILAWGSHDAVLTLREQAAEARSAEGTQCWAVRLSAGLCSVWIGLNKHDSFNANPELSVQRVIAP